MAMESNKKKSRSGGERRCFRVKVILVWQDHALRVASRTCPDQFEIISASECRAAGGNAGRVQSEGDRGGSETFVLNLTTGKSSHAILAENKRLGNGSSE